MILNQIRIKTDLNRELSVYVGQTHTHTHTCMIIISENRAQLSLYISNSGLYRAYEKSDLFKLLLYIRIILILFSLCGFFPLSIRSLSTDRAIPTK